MNLKQVYTCCVQTLGKTDGVVLYEHVTNSTLSDMLTHPEKEVDVELDAYFIRAKSGEPIQYITGKTEFMSLPFTVTPAVLIPRQDTELLVEFALEKLSGKENVKGLDLCTGSGCIAVSLAHYAGANVTAVDISKEALQVAIRNAEINGVSVRFEQADAKTYTKQKNLDFILSNPPYIESAVVDTLEKKVKDFEPRLALDGGKEGLDFYALIAENSFNMLKKGGFLAVEIGYNQGKAVTDIFKKVFGNAALLKDLCGQSRVVFAFKENI